MGTEIVVDVVPKRIDPAAWAEAFDETLSLLAKHPARLVGCDLRVAAGVPVEVYTRSIERDAAAGREHARRWCVAGSMGSFGTGEPQSMYRDLARYREPCPVQGPEDLLLHAAEDAGSTRFGAAALARGGADAVGVLDGGIVRVLGGRAPGLPSQLPLLAAAMVIEGRFPQHAMVHGDIDRELAEAARRWASAVLGRPVALPVRVDAWRLVERLGARPSARGALVRAVDRLYLADDARKDAALFGIFGRAEAEPWWLAKLRAHPHPGAPGARRLLSAYLEATQDLARMCGLACLDTRGPRYAPDDLADALGALEERPGDVAVAEAFASAFGADAPRLVSTFSTRARVDRPGSNGAAPRAPTEHADGGGRSPEDEIEALAGLSSAADLSPGQRDHIHALSFLARERPAIPGPPATLRRTIAGLLARGGPVLTEDAWAWIEREEDTEVLGLLAALAALEHRDPDLARVRRALFERRALSVYAVGALRDGAIMAAVASRVAAEA